MSSAAIVIVSLLLSLCRCAVVSGRLEAEPDGFHAVVVGAERVRGEAHLHAEGDLLRCGVDVDEPQSTMAATNGTGTPGEANVTMVKDLTMPSVGTDTFLKSVLKHAAHALRRSKKRAPHAVHSFASRCGLSPSTR
jgi:hypothetical protein